MRTFRSSAIVFLVFVGWVALAALLGAPPPAEAENACFPESPTECLHHRWQELPDGRRVECLLAETRYSVAIDCNWPSDG